MHAFPLHLFRCAPLAIAMALAATPAQASVVMNATRFVYPEGTREITVKVTNVGKLPALTQAWIDDGDEKSTPEDVDVPFNLTPPIARVEAGKAQTLRIAFTAGTPPTDRESLYWLNVLEVPPQPELSPEASKMQLAFRYRLKLFYRPKGLPGVADAAPGALTWSVGGDGAELSVRNPTPFHVTINDLKVVTGDTTVTADAFAVAPLQTITVTLASPLPKGSTATAVYQSINDYGGFTPHRKPIGR